VKQIPDPGAKHENESDDYADSYPEVGFLNANHGVPQAIDKIEERIKSGKRLGGFWQHGNRIEYAAQKRQRHDHKYIQNRELLKMP